MGFGGAAQLFGADGWPDPAGPAGRYGFAAISNDGVRVTIDRHRVVDDPYVHATQTSPTTWIEVPQAGWYPLTVKYFQKGGTAALKLLWQPPGASSLSVVPAAALAHQ